jgi:ABC-2 type transport system ATP-binding protein
MNPMPVEAHNLSHAFGSVKAVNALSFGVSEGEIFGLIGADGAGKTTTMRILAGLIDPTAGEVRILGDDPRNEKSGIRTKLGYMPQRYSLYGDLSIRENLTFFGKLFCLSPQEFAERTARLLAITRLEQFHNRRADALSGGMYKKLALSCALLHEPKVLLLDEPTNGVDPISRIELWDLMYTFRDAGMTIVVSTSYMDEAARCSQVGLMHKGKMLAMGDPDTLAREGLGVSENTIPHFETYFLSLMEKHP